MTKRKSTMPVRDAMDLVDADLPDGAYWALVGEMAGADDPMADLAEEDDFSMVQQMRIWCVACNRLVEALLTDGRTIYPHRKDLQSLPFWKCLACGNYVGCHHKTNDPTRPLGNIPSPELRELRKEIH